MFVQMEAFRTLIFETINDNFSINIIGGSAKDDLFGKPIKTLKGTADSKGKTIGENYIYDGTYSRVHSIPYILGNCANFPKTLIIRVTNMVDSSYVDYTVTFDQNYMTSDGAEYSYNTTPAISQSEIISNINESYSSVFKISVLQYFFDTMDDCKEEGYNTGEVLIKMKQAVVRDFMNGVNSWRRANTNEIAEGIAGEDIPVGERGRILLIDKNFFSYYACGLWQPVTKGTLYKVINGNFAETNDSNVASLYACGVEGLAKYPH